MFFTWFFPIFAILTSGFFIPIENMPEALQKLTYVNPRPHFMTIVRGIMTKGAGPGELRSEVMALEGFSLTMFGLAWLRFAKRVG